MASNNHSFSASSGVLRITCTHCGKGFSKRLGQCPVCFPPVKQNAVDKQAIIEKERSRWRSLSSAPLNVDPLWSQASEMTWCHGGSGGVFLLQVPNGAICVKAEECAPEMLFAARLADVLDVHIAKMRAVPVPSEEAKSIVRALRSSPSTFDDDRNHGLSSATSICVLEYIGGCAMMGMPAHSFLAQARDCPRVWHTLGRLIGFDLLINNFDRLPLAWSNDGNLGNVMLGSQRGVVGVDQSVRPITHPDGLRTYLKRVEEACLEAFGDSGPSFTRVKEAIYNNTAIELSPEEMDHMRGGCLELLQSIALLSTSGKIEELVERLAAEVAAELQIAGSDRSLHRCSNLVLEVARVVHGVMPERRNNNSR